MNIWAKMITALRGGINEAGEAIVDTQALRILDQEVREATEELKQSKDGLAGIIAQQKLAQETASQLQIKTKEYEDYAIKAMGQGDESLALEIAGKIADLESRYEAEEKSARSFAKSADTLRAAIRQAEQNIKRLKQQVDTVKATENVQRAQAAVAQRYSGSNSKLRTAMDSLERIKEKQAFKNAQMQAAEEIAEETAEDLLQAKLESAGIVGSNASAQLVLERLKQNSG